MKGAVEYRVNRMSTKHDGLIWSTVGYATTNECYNEQFYQ